MDDRDDYMDKLVEHMRENKEKLDAMVERRFAVEGLPLQLEDRGEQWLARRGSFVGLGETKQAALEDLQKKIDLHFGGAFTA